MMTVGNTLNIVAEGLLSIYGDEAKTMAHFVLRQCRERQDSAGEQVWNQLLERITTLEVPPPPDRRPRRFL
jgi:hypothetical protein